MGGFFGLLVVKIDFAAQNAAHWSCEKLWSVTCIWPIIFTVQCSWQKMVMWAESRSGVAAQWTWVVWLRSLVPVVVVGSSWTNLTWQSYMADGPSIRKGLRHLRMLHNGRFSERIWCHLSSDKASENEWLFSQSSTGMERRSSKSYTTGNFLCLFVLYVCL